MRSVPDPPGPSICVVAHPDDEVLWFASVLRRVDRVVLVFGDSPRHPELGERRAEAIAGLPYDVVWLGIREAGTYGRVHWRSPRISDHGITLECPPNDIETAVTYARNFRRLRKELAALIPPDSTVFTHNPWGEYGHADHVQVFRVLEGLRQELGLHLQVSPYVSRQSRPLAERYGLPSGAAPRWRSIEPGYAHRVAETYKRHGCWTWAADWEWYDSESMLDAPLPLTRANLHPPVTEHPALLRVPSRVEERTHCVGTEV